MPSSRSYPVTTAASHDIRLRFCPSPTGTPHVGMVRTALFNWAYARHTGGKLVFRIEDTDAERDSEESYRQIVEALRWLQIDWDEGVEVGGAHGPYRQSQRGEIYRDVIRRLAESGHVYESFATAAEIEARNVSLGRDAKTGYDNFERELTDAQRRALRDEGRRPALRLRVPDTDLGFDDLVRGTITFPAGSFTDFVVVRPNGAPLYTLVNPIDDAMMGVTHVLRGDDILSSTPRQIALYHALIDLGIASAVPRFGHLPTVLGEGTKKLSKRDPESNLFHHRDRGFIPEGLLNYLALLGWGFSADRDVFTREEMIAAFDVADVKPNPARFDLRKAESLNGDHIRMLSDEDFAERSVPYLVRAGVLHEPVGAGDRAVLAAAAPLVKSRVRLLGETPGMFGFLFVDAAALVIDDDARATLKPDAGDVLVATRAALDEVGDAEWQHERIEAVLRAALVESRGLKPRLAFGPLRVAVTGRRVSPPLFESMEILGRTESLARVDKLAVRLTQLA
ncbi:MAG TPA: glutamate--tRNA ligase [Microbacteriaceae bacterium]|nr:glutamate--tRNA ligase [Microbacteriaceae bacterium]